MTSLQSHPLSVLRRDSSAASSDRPTNLERDIVVEIARVPHAVILRRPVSINVLARRPIRTGRIVAASRQFQFAPERPLHDFRGIPLISRLIGPFPGFGLALRIDPESLAKAVFGNADQRRGEYRNAVPFVALAIFARFPVLPPLGHRDRQIADLSSVRKSPDSRIPAQVSDENHLVYRQHCGLPPLRPQFGRPGGSYPRMPALPRRKRLKPRPRRTSRNPPIRAARRSSNRLRYRFRRHTASFLVLRLRRRYRAD